jgi:hypothetical protein
MMSFTVFPLQCSCEAPWQRPLAPEQRARVQALDKNAAGAKVTESQGICTIFAQIGDHARFLSKR